MSITAHIALGSNLGDRHLFLDRALMALNERPGMVVSQVSAYYETAPVGGPPGQNPYLNAAAELQTDLPPAQVLQALLEVERSLGRVRQERYGPRTIDLDLLMYGSQVIKEPGLEIPHPRMHERSFVLVPLAEIAPNVVHPELRCSIQEIKKQLAQAADQPVPVHFSRPTKDLVFPPGAFMDPRGIAMRNRDLMGLRALVTGSTSGIGRTIVLELAAAGADVVIHGRRFPDCAVITAENARRLGVDAKVMVADLRKPADCRRLVQTAWDLFDGLDIWINNAGVDTLTGDAVHWPFERKLEELWSVDVRATMLLSREVGRRMKERGKGVILNMGWDQADVGMEGDSGQMFAAIKSAIMAFSKSLALALAPEVRVNCLAPGWIRTAWGEKASERWQERVIKETPLGRWGTPKDVADTAHWLASPGASFITGQVIRVNGGAVR